MVNNLSRKQSHISVKEADKLLQLRDQLIEEFKDVKRAKIGIYNKNKQQEQPLIDGINDVKKDLGNKIEKVVEHNINTALVPITQNTNTPTQTETQRQTPTRVLPLTDYATTTLRPTVSKCLNIRNDKTFGIIGGLDGKNIIGNAEVTFDNDNYIIKGTKYKATEGLSKLLTMNVIPEDNTVTPEDLLNYENILFDTHAIYQNNDPRTNHSKSSRSDKYNNYIKPMWERRMKSVPLSNLYFSPSRPRASSYGDVFGSGLHKYNELPKEFVWMDDVRKLVDRLVIIMGEEDAGNDNLYNEKVGIVNMICDRLSHFVLDNSKNLGYLIKIINILPPRFWDKQGKGLVNSALNIKGMPEMHLPGFNYCGPFTKLDERLERGDKGINPLDEEGCKVHDIDYRDNKDLESRHKADKKLEHKAWERLFSKDADLRERLAALAVGTVMNRKVAWGWGL
jgi:hypothetical protein